MHSYKMQYIRDDADPIDPRNWKEAPLAASTLGPAHLQAAEVLKALPHVDYRYLIVAD